MKHDEAYELLAALSLDAVEADEREAIEAHVLGCPRCRSELDALLDVAGALGNSVEPLPEGLWTSISSRIYDADDDVHGPFDSTRKWCEEIAEVGLDPICEGAYHGALVEIRRDDVSVRSLREQSHRDRTRAGAQIDGHTALGQPRHCSLHELFALPSGDVHAGCDEDL